jgi:hypothetical protein
MKYIVHVIITLSIKFIEKCESLEHAKEKTWMDSRGKDKFFDYAEYTEPKNNNNYYYSHKNSGDSVNNYSSNLDLDLFVTVVPQVCYRSNYLTSLDN